MKINFNCLKSKAITHHPPKIRKCEKLTNVNRPHLSPHLTNGLGVLKQYGIYVIIMENNTESTGGCEAMEENLSRENSKKSTAGTVSVIINILAVLMFFLFAVQSRFRVSVFILVSILTVNYLCIKPIIEYATEVSASRNDGLFTGAVVLGLKTAYVAGVLFTANRIVFTYPIVEDGLYWFYNLMAIILLIICVIGLIEGFIGNIAELKSENAPFERYIGRLLIAVLAFIFGAIIPLTNLYQPNRIITLDNLKKPIGFHIIDYTNDVQDTYLLNHNTKDIWDMELAEDFYNAVSKIQAQNIRNLDLLNYKAKYINNKSYYAILPIYEESKYSHVNELDRGYIYKVKLHKNGEVILIDTESEKEMYRLALPGNLVEKIFTKIK